MQTVLAHYLKYMWIAMISLQFRRGLFLFDGLCYISYFFQIRDLKKKKKKKNRIGTLYRNFA